jgi:N-acetylneuraminic acid mutarotase
MYVLCGICSESTVASVFKFDSTQDMWSVVEPMPEPRKLHAVCSIGSNIYVFGGRFDHEDHTSSFKLDTRTETNTWSTLEPMPLPSSRSTHSVSVLDDDQVYIVGAGYDGEGVLRLDTASGSWSMPGATSSNKHGSATFVVGGCLYVAGGIGNSSSVERYDVASDTWTAMADMFNGREVLCAVTIGSVEAAEDQDLFDSLIAKAVVEPNLG